ncbi:unnamed protein product [Callosobruchus maculatus]|uniref:Sugar phosphate transporter domain-containing protein n=1 Tax=Callosobruchus maculatus TaxID=64391 RepID=A0A653BJF2_CALMS|nr:unnamed protein product [Callosobruchus maculatus]
MITVVNKTVLTSYEFPSFQVLGIGQMVATIVLLFAAKKLRIVTFPGLELGTFRKIFPLPLIYIGNMFFGLGGTKQLSLPMFTALRRFSILMTMILELYILGIKPSFSVQFSVYLMIIGAIVAAGFILSYSVILCTLYNSALTTTIIGTLKNICVTYLGMVIGGDYIFSWVNFIGINVSVLGSLLYTYVTFKRKEATSYSPLPTNDKQTKLEIV